jgi:hypothetical protein
MQEVMSNAQIDLAATIDGRFSPADWQSILTQAEQHLQEFLRRHPQATPLDAWQDTIRDFHRNHYWGFTPNHRAVKPKKEHLALWFIWITINTFTTMKVLILWFGQIYSRSDDAKDFWIFMAVLLFSFGNIVYFVVRHHRFVNGQTVKASET